MGLCESSPRLYHNFKSNKEAYEYILTNYPNTSNYKYDDNYFFGKYKHKISVKAELQNQNSSKLQRLITDNVPMYYDLFPDFFEKNLEIYKEWNYKSEIELYNMMKYYIYEYPNIPIDEWKNPILMKEFYQFVKDRIDRSIYIPIAIEIIKIREERYLQRIEQYTQPPSYDEIDSK